MQTRYHQPTQQITDPTAGGHRGTHGEGEPDHVPRVRFPLTLVGVEDALRQPSVDHPGELPGQVRRIPQSRAEALADEGRGQVGGVAEKEHAAAAPTIGDLRPEGVLGDPQHREPFCGNALHPGPDQRIQRGEGAVVRGGLAGKQPELPAVAFRADPHVGGGPVRVAHLVDAVPLVQFRVSGHIDHQPPLLEPEVFHRRTDGGADQAVGAVAAEDETRLHPALLAGDAVGERHPAPPGPDRDDLGDLGIGPQHRARVALQVRPKQSFELGLIEHTGLRVAIGALGAGTVELRHHPELGITELQARGGP